MVELNLNTNNCTTKHALKRSTPKVDLTAMVDLGFLLITFFMLASSLQESRIIEVAKPEENREKASYPQSKILTILLSANDKAYCYSGADDLNEIDMLQIDSVDFSASGLRKVIFSKQHEVEVKFGQSHKDDLYILIKPMPNSKLKNTIDVLDEMNICGINKFTIHNPDAKIDALVALKINQKL